MINTDIGSVGKIHTTSVDIPRNMSAYLKLSSVGPNLPLDVVALSFRRKAQEAMLGVHFLAWLRLSALLAIIALGVPSLLLSSWTILLPRKVVLDVRRNFVEGTVELIEEAEAAAAAASGRPLLRTLYFTVSDDQAMTDMLEEAAGIVMTLANEAYATGRCTQHATAKSYQTECTHLLVAAKDAPAHIANEAALPLLTLLLLVVVAIRHVVVPPVIGHVVRSSAPGNGS